jgi:phage terminase Nu1 subunit (DNA packaging protein)
MAKRAKQNAKTQSEILKGWKQISDFLGEPPSVVQRWASEGMPVIKQGRFVTTSPDQLNAWLGKESGKPVHVATESTDLAAELKRGLSYIRNEQQPNRAKKPVRKRTN